MTDTSPLRSNNTLADSTALGTGKDHVRFRRLLEWEHLVLEISTSLISTDASALDRSLSNALSELGAFSGADRCYVFVYDAADDTMTNTHEWCRDDIEPQQEHLQGVPASVWPYWMERMRQHQLIDWPHIGRLPDAAAAEREQLMAQDIKSVVAVPMIDAGELIGFVGFDSVQSERYWGPDETYLLRMSANVISHAMARVRTERELRAVREELLHTSRLEALGRFVGGTAHDFNNLLTVILGNCEFALASDDAESVRRSLGDIADAASRAAELTGSLLAFGRRQEFDPQPLEVNEFIRRTEGFLSRVLGETAALTCTLDADTGFVLADEGRMQHVLLNLAANARDAMPEGGELRISARRLDDLDRRPTVRIELSDDGVGMDEATLERAFDPFYTTKGLHAGTGLGLSSVHGIVNQSGGTVSIESAPGVGTTVRIDLPAVAPPGRGRHRSDADDAENSHLEATVLLVEDDEAVSKVIRRHLELSGLVVVTAGDGELALSLLSADDPGIDLVVTDIVMPGMSGTELIGRARELRPTLPIVAVTGYSEKAMEPIADDEQSVRLLSKPFSGKELIALVDELLS